MRKKSDILVVELGGNDGWRGKPVASIRQNLKQIIDKTKATGCRVLLLGMRLPPSYGQEYTEEFAALYDELASEHDVAYVSYFMEGVGGVAEMNLPDQLHPNVAGHERLAQKIAPVLVKLLSDAKSK